MPTRDREPLLRVNAFEVLMGDRELGFSHVGPLTSETDLEAPLDRPPHRFQTVVLRRALTRSTELYDWRRHIVDGKDDRRDVTIRQLSTPGGTTVNAWRLVRAWPCRWSGPTLDALSADIATEELELAFEDLVWLDGKPD
jgi:T4-like virus tail tube protein gp19